MTLIALLLLQEFVNMSAVAEPSKGVQHVGSVMYIVQDVTEMKVVHTHTRLCFGILYTSR